MCDGYSTATACTAAVVAAAAAETADAAEGAYTVSGWPAAGCVSDEAESRGTDGRTDGPTEGFNWR